jgi:hypothetical protein
LVGLARAKTELFKTKEDRFFADVKKNSHRETLRIKSKEFRRWLTREYFQQVGATPSPEAMKSTLDTLEALADVGPTHEVYIRVAHDNGTIYLDLCDSDRRVVEITEDGWKIIDEAPVRFRRAAGMLPLPEPVKGGKIDDLRSHINVASDDDFVLVIAWLLGSIAPMQHAGTYPLLSIAGEHGSAKSTLLDFIRALVDPNALQLRALPREERDLFIAANAGFVLAYDNVSKLPGWLSDALCRIAYGGGLSLRGLYTDDEEVTFSAKRPILLNGIPDVVDRHDLADRTIFMHAPTIPKERRRTEAKIRAAFEADRPKLLGALLGIVAHGLAQLPTTALKESPRLADFTRWVVACEGAFAKPARGRFLDIYDRRITEATQLILEGDALADAIKSLMATTERWEGSASDLLKELNRRAGDDSKRSPDWPKAPNVLTNALRRLAPGLRDQGIDYAAGKGAKGKRRVTLARTGPAGEGERSPPPPPSGDYDDDSVA